MGLPLKSALPILTDILERRGLRDRIWIIASGKLVTQAEVAWAYCAGADVVNTGRGFMFSIGCIQALRCHTNNCPTGVTIHKKSLQAGLDPTVKSVRAASYVDKMRKDVAMIAHSCGTAHARDLIRWHVGIVQEDGASAPLDELLERMRPKAPLRSLTARLYGLKPPALRKAISAGVDRRPRIRLRYGKRPKRLTIRQCSSA